MWCARCSKRLIYMRGRNRHGHDYFYFVCKGRLLSASSTEPKCGPPYLGEEVLEKHVEQFWTHLHISTTETQHIQGELTDTLGSNQLTQKHLAAKLRRELSLLDNQENQILELIGDSAWPAEKLTQKMLNIQTKRDSIQASLDDTSQHAADYDASLNTISIFLDMLTSPHELYKCLPDTERKVMNAACLTRLYVDAHDPDWPNIQQADISDEASPLINHVRTQRDTSRPDNKKARKTTKEAVSRARKPNIKDQCSNKVKLVDLADAYLNTKPQVISSLKSILDPVNR